MLRVSAASFAAISIAIACGQTLPASPDEDPPAPEAGTDAPASTDTSIDNDAESDAAVDSASDANDGGGCTTESPYGSASPLDHFEGLGAVSSVRLNRAGTVAFVSTDLGNSTSFDIGELDYPAPPSPLPATIRDTAAREENPAPLSDERTVFWDQPIDGGARRIFSATRAQPGQNLGTAVEEQIPRGGKTQALMPWSVAGTGVFYFVLENAGSDTADIHRGVRSGSSSWSVTTQISSAFDDTHPVVSDDEMVIYFARNESGKRRIHFAKRTAAGEPWGNPIEMQGDVNTTGHDSYPTWISPDQCTLVFVSNRGGSLRPYKIERVRQ